jgi:hypothetical protein
MRFSTLSALFFATLAVSAPVELEQRQSATTCGNNYYSYSKVNAAFKQGYNYYANGEEAGSSTYP